jgi:hypothetical protein
MNAHNQLRPRLGMEDNIEHAHCLLRPQPI